MRSTSSSAPTLDLDALTIRYDDFVAVDRLDLQVRAGHVYGLIGPNGSGKSSTFAGTVGLLSPASGAVRICGRPVSEPIAREQLGYAPDTLPLPAALTGREVLAFWRRVQPGFDQRLADSLTELLGLSDDLDKLLGAYSHGMTRKFRLICALSHRPALVVLDEPFNGLDPVAAIAARELLRRFAADGGAALVATHDLRGAEQYCQEVGVLDHGVLVAEGTPEALRTRFDTDSLEGVFVAASGLQGDVDLSRRRVEASFA